MDNHENAVRIFYSDFKKEDWDFVIRHTMYHPGWSGDYDAVTKSIRVELYDEWYKEKLKQYAEKFAKAHGTVVFAKKSEEVPSWNFEDVLMYFKNNGEVISDNRKQTEESHTNGGYGFGGRHPVGGLRVWNVVTTTYTGSFKFRGITVEYKYEQDAIEGRTRVNRTNNVNNIVFKFYREERDEDNAVYMTAKDIKIGMDTPVNVVLKFIIRTCKAMEVKHA